MTFGAKFLDGVSKEYQKYPYGLAVGLVSGFSVRHWIQNKKKASLLGILAGSACGLFEILLGNKIGLQKAVDCIGRIRTIKDISDAINLKSYDIVCMLEEIIKKIGKSECLNDQQGQDFLNSVMTTKASERKVSRDKIKNRLFSENQESTFLKFLIEKIREHIVSEVSQKVGENFTIQSLETLEEEKYEQMKNTKKDLFQVDIKFIVSNEINSKGCYQLSENLEPYRQFFSILLQCKYLLEQYSRLAPDLFEQRQERDSRKTKVLSAAKPWLVLLANAVNFTAPLLALSFLPEKIRGGATDFVITSLLTMFVDGLNTDTLDKIGLPCCAMGLFSFVTRFNLKTSYNILKRELTSENPREIYYKKIGLK